MTRSRKCHNNPVFFPPRKSYDHVKDLYNGHTYDSKTRVVIWTGMDVVPIKYGTFTHTVHLKMCFYQFITGIKFKWDYVMRRTISLLVWIVVWIKLSTYRVSPESVR